MFQTGRYYSVKHKDRDVQISSSSGGAFSAISDVVLEQGGIVIGGGVQLLERFSRILCLQDKRRERSVKRI